MTNEIDNLIKMMASVLVEHRTRLDSDEDIIMRLAHEFEITHPATCAFVIRHWDEIVAMAKLMMPLPKRV